MGDEKEVYNITQAAKMFKVASSLIRYWESEFDILDPEKDDKGNRIYHKKDIDNLRVVYHLVKEKGYTLKGAKKVLKEKREGTIAKVEVIQTLRNVKTDLEAIKAKLG